MRAVLLAVTVALVLPWTLPAAQDQAPAFRSGVDLVAVDTLVIDRRQPVRGLTPKDFVLLDNGVRQTIRDVSVERLPLRVVLWLDVSSSVAGARLAQLRTAASAVVNKLRPDDRASVGAFSHRLTPLVPLTADRGRLLDAINGLQAQGSTALRDAALASMIGEAGGVGRTLVVLFSDGVDTASLLGEQDVLRAARRTDAVVYPVTVRQEPPRRATMLLPSEMTLRVQRDAASRRFLTELAGETGGRLLVADNDRDLTPAFETILEEFRQRYVLFYTPQGVDRAGWHTLQVSVPGRKGAITARRGYESRGGVSAPQ